MKLMMEKAMASDVIMFPTRPGSDITAARPSRPNLAVQPTISIALLLRGAGDELQPFAVALALIATKSNTAAAPVWVARREAFKDLIHARGIRGLRAEQLYQGWRALVRAEGVAEKARRRQEQEAVFRMFEQMAAGIDPLGDTA